MPGSEDIKLFVAGAAIGKLEAMAKADANFALNKVPRPVTQLGYTGGTALALWVASKFVGGSIGHYARLGARAAATIALYQIGSKGGSPGTSVLSLSGWEDEISGPEFVIEDGSMGALSAEGDAMSGLPFDDRVEEPMT